MAQELNTKPTAQTHIKDLILLLAVPLSVALIAVAAVYIPQALARPAHDFIYTTCSSYDCTTPFSVGSDGKITTEPSLGLSSGDPSSLRFDDYYDTRDPVLHYYNVRDNSSRTISYQEAQAYHLSDSSRSPDGYTLDEGNSSSGFLFWGSTDSGWYLRNGILKKPVDIDIDSNRSYSSDGINLIGWVD